MMTNELYKRILTSIILIPLLFFIIFKGSYFFLLTLLLVFFISIIELFKLNKKLKLVNYFGLFFLIFSFYTAYLLRGSTNESALNFLFVIIICISTDIGGYIFGKIFKGPKVSSISPNKTYSGIFGSYILSIISSLFFIKYFINIKINIIDIIFLIISISTISQLGDLLISFLKRVNKVKDTSNILPGHGGLLDRIDGMIFAVPFFYIVQLIIIF